MSVLMHDEHGTRRGVAQDVVQCPVCDGDGIKGDILCATLEDGEDGNDKVHAASSEDADSMARTNTLCSKTVGEAVRLDVELVVGEGVVKEGVFDRNSVGLYLDVMLKGMMHYGEAYRSARAEAVGKKGALIVSGEVGKSGEHRGGGRETRDGRTVMQQGITSGEWCL